MTHASPPASGELVELNVLQNAYDFIDEGLRYAALGAENPVAWKFAIVLAAQAIELLLKARLEVEHPLLIQANPDRTVPGTTVGVDSAIKRLENAGVILSKEDIDRFLRAHRLRNEFVHYRVRATVDQLESAFADLFEFAHAFHAEHLDGELHNHISQDLYVCEAAMIERFRRESVVYQGTEMPRTFPSEIVDSQFALHVRVNGQLLSRVRYGAPGSLFVSEGPCDDCDVLLGQLHVWGCDLEACPSCGGQMLGCDCEQELEFADEIESFAPGRHGS